MVLLALSIVNDLKKIFRCLYRRCPPLPIPNREVKPARADGIAVTGGRVGRRLFLYEKPVIIDHGLFSFLLVFLTVARFVIVLSSLCHGKLSW